MQFIYPSFLWAATLLAIPILIHLFNFQRAKKVYFTNIAFLKEIKSVSSAQNKLRHLLVLLMRCLAILALVLAFAQPYLPAPQAVSNTVNSNYVSIYADNSFSMQAEKGNKKLLDATAQYGEQIVKLFPKNTVFQVLTNGFEGNMNYFADAKKAEENLRRLDFSATNRQLKNVYERQQNAFFSHTSSKSNYIFWISDFQKNMFDKFDTQTIDSTNIFYLVPQQADQNTNLYVDSVWLENPFIKISENNTLFVKINCVGKNGVAERTAKLFIDGKQVSNGTINLEAGSSSTIKMNFAVQESGAKNCKISLEDSPILFDNDYFFTLEAAPMIKIVHISAGQDKFIENVYGQEAFFKLQSFNTNSIDYNALQTADLIILQDLPMIDNALFAALQKFSLAGKNLVVFPSQNFDQDNYTALLGVLAQKVGNEKLELLPPDTQNPFFAGVFEKITPNINMPFGLQTLQINGGGQNLLKFKNGNPYLKLLTNGKSKTFAFASPLNQNFSDLGKHAIFVPLMYKIALSSASQSGKLAYNFDENFAEIALPDSSNNKNEIFKLVQTSTQTALIPTQRITDGKLFIEIPKTNILAGNYQIIRKTDDKIMGAVAFNYSKSESASPFYTSEELKNLFKNKGNVQIFGDTDANNFAARFQEKNVAKPLWRYLIVAALLFLLIEILLLRFFKH
jgi:hypothetical protein